MFALSDYIKRILFYTVQKKYFYNMGINKISLITHPISTHKAFSQAQPATMCCTGKKVNKGSNISLNIKYENKIYLFKRSFRT